MDWQAAPEAARESRRRRSVIKVRKEEEDEKMEVDVSVFGSFFHARR
jgi:hypothetical protein